MIQPVIYCYSRHRHDARSSMLTYVFILCYYHELYYCYHCHRNFFVQDNKAGSEAHVFNDDSGSVLSSADSKQLRSRAATLRQYLMETNVIEELARGILQTTVVSDSSSDEMTHGTSLHDSVAQQLGSYLVKAGQLAAHRAEAEAELKYHAGCALLAQLDEQVS
jgi:hypothetical protein